MIHLIQYHLQPTLSYLTFIAANGIVRATVSITHIPVFLIPVGFNVSDSRVPYPKEIHLLIIIPHETNWFILWNRGGSETDRNQVQVVSPMSSLRI